MEIGLNTKAAAAMLGVTAGTMSVWRARGTGPPFRCSGSRIVYLESELRVWQGECLERRREKLMSRREEKLNAALRRDGESDEGKQRDATAAR